MATNNPIMLSNDQLLLNRSDKTYKISFGNLANDIADEINEKNYITIDTLTGIQTDIYVSGRDASTNAPTELKFTNESPESDGSGVSKQSNHWLLQYIPTNNPIGIGTSNAKGPGDFVLSDPATVLKDVLTGGAVELNNLKDVVTKSNGVDYDVVTAGNSFLLSTGMSADGIPLYGVAELDAAVNLLLQNGTINIGIENINEINPNLNASGERVEGFLEITAAYEAGIPNSPKYTWTTKQVENDAIFVYIDTPTTMIENSTPGGEIVGVLEEGWYIAENFSSSSGAKFADSQIADAASDYNQDNTVAVNDKINLGVVRVADYIGTSIKDTNGAGQVDGNSYVAAVDEDTAETNIGITSDGILYTRIPKSINFRQTIDVAGDNYLTDFKFGGSGESVPNVGPRFHTAPHLGSVGTNNPTVGDMYVFRFDKDANGDPLVTDVNVDWNNQNTSAAPFESDAALTVNDGDMVIKGEQGWIIMGSVNTDTIGQDLSDVTGIGNETDNGIILADGGNGSGLLVGTPKIGDGLNTGDPAEADAGDVACEVLKAQNIDFNMYTELT